MRCRKCSNTGGLDNVLDTPPIKLKTGHTPIYPKYKCPRCGAIYGEYDSGYGRWIGRYEYETYRGGKMTYNDEIANGRTSESAEVRCGCCGSSSVNRLDYTVRPFRLRTGKQPLVAMAQCMSCKAVQGMYQSGYYKWAKPNTIERYTGMSNGDMKEISDTVFGKKEEETMKTLYEIKEGDVVKFGHKLAVNSSGQWVMEVKGTNEVIVTDTANVTEVLPYTIGVKYLGADKVYHFFARQGDYEVGDLVWSAYYDKPMHVTAVGTKSRVANKWLIGWKIKAEHVDFAGDN